jgi:hypothetical protein
MLATWTSVPLTAIIGMKRGNKAVQKEVGKDVEAAPQEQIHVGGDQAGRRTNIWYGRSPSKGGLDGRP